LNAANFGVPQKRDRVFIVGFRSDLGIEWNFKDGDHTQEALLFDQYVSGEYWTAPPTSSEVDSGSLKNASFWPWNVPAWQTVAEQSAMRSEAYLIP